MDDEQGSSNKVTTGGISDISGGQVNAAGRDVVHVTHNNYGQPDDPLKDYGQSSDLLKDYTDQIMSMLEKAPRGEPDEALLKMVQLRTVITLHMLPTEKKGILVLFLIDAGLLKHVSLRAVNLTGVDLSGFDLANADMGGADLSGANLSGADLGRANLSRANLGRANLSRANLSGANLTGADLTGADLTGALLILTNLTMAIMPNGKMRP